MESFAIAPASMRAMWFILLIPGLIVVLVVGVLGLAMHSARAARFEISPEGLRLRGDLYGRLIPLGEIQTPAARRVDFAITPELRPRWRTWGTGLPGYSSGWFRLRNGEKALVYLTDRDRAVYVPTTAGYAVMLSPADPDAFLEALRRRGRM